MLGPFLRGAVERFKRAIEDRWPGRILDVRVFGSVARGEQHAESDLDVFVMVDEIDSEIKYGICDAAWSVNYELDMPFQISTLVMSKEHFEELLRRERRIAQDILNEGIVV